MKRAATSPGSLGSSVHSLPSILEHRVLDPTPNPTGPGTRLPPVCPTTWIHQDLLESATIYAIGLILVGLAFALDEAMLARQ